ncbi:MAG TPA: NAD(P)-dependent oxidoreductase [Conexibacter sp.]|nr:NAD(P)-dependent oxidoreductase [Conexibacter sp.]
MSAQHGTVLVTGAAGGIGRVAVAHLAARGWDVRAFDRRPAEGLPDGVEQRVGELADVAVARAAVAGVDRVVHLAAIPSPWNDPDDVVYVGNSAATFAVLEAAGAAGIRRAVIASSVSIYGIVWSEREQEAPEIPLSETSELRIADPYALSKQADEACAEMVHRRYGIDVLALRFPNVSDAENIAERSRRVLADPDHAHRELWAYLHLDDAARAIELALTAEVAGAHAVNVVAPDTLGGVDVAELAKRFHPGAPCRLPLGGSVTGYTTDRAERLLGFHAEHRWDGRRTSHAHASKPGGLHR